MNMNLPIGGGADYPGVVEKPRIHVRIQQAQTEEPVKAPKEAIQQNGVSLQISEAQLTKAISRAIKAMEGTTTTLNFTIHEATKHIIVKVLNKETGEIIREIPSEKNLDFLAKVWEMAGSLVDERV